MKKLVINTANIDTTGLREEHISEYESVQFNCALVISSPESNELLRKHNVRINCSSVIVAPEGGRVLQQNGVFLLDANAKLEPNTVLLVNGKVDIEAGADLSNLLECHINGVLSYPDTMSEYLTRFRVNGVMDSYPGDAIKLNPKFAMDATFPLRAQARKYYAKNLIVLGEGIDIGRLAEKGCSFVCRKLIISEQYIEKFASLLVNEPEFIILPEGCKYVENEHELTELLLTQYGTKLYVEGNFSVDRSAAAAFAKLQYLNVSAELQIHESLLENLKNMYMQYQRIQVLSGTVIKEKPHVKVESGMFELLPPDEKLYIMHCATVTIDEDLDSKLLLDRLVIKACAAVQCSADQRQAVELISLGIGRIDSSEEGADDLNDGMLAADKDTTVINAASYKF